MTLIQEYHGYPKTALRTTVKQLRADLVETLETVQHPRGRVLDPVGLENAATLLSAAIAAIDRPGPREPRALALDANLGYAALVASIDLLKSHTDVPRVPARRGGDGATAGR